MNKRRLLKLADLLEADAKNKKGMKFDLHVVGYANDAEAGGTAELNCGTKACAMGLAAMSGAFKRQGLSYKITNGWLNNIETTVDGRRRDYDRAAMQIFDIDYVTANFLFTPSFYPSEMDKSGGKAERFVAKRIRDFVAGNVSP